MIDDLIKRSDAIEAIECVDWYHQNSNKDMVSGANSDEHQAWYKANDVYKALEAVPSADRPQGWIPCNERLPNENEWVLCSCNNGFTILILKLKGKVWYKTEFVEYLPKFVNAWMPLPEPWKGANEQ